MADIPLGDAEKFDAWLRDVWYQKDALMEQYLTTGRFPPSPGSAVVEGKEGFVETEVRTRYPWEFLQIFVVLGVFGLVWNLLARVWAKVTGIF